MKFNQFAFRTTLRRWAFVPALAAILVAGCTTPRTTSPVTATPVTKNRVLNARGAGKEVEEARRMIKAGDYSIVIPRLQHTMSKYPRSVAALDARYFLGITYYKIGSYRDAIDIFEEYLRLAPKGRYAAEGRDYVARLTDEYQRKFLTAEKIDARIRALHEKLEADPDKFEYQWALADLLWKRGNYGKAARLYMNIVKQHPEYANDATVTGRVDVLPNGQYIVLTPVEMERRQIERQPVEVVNVNSFRGAREFYTGETLYFVVTGQVINRSDSVLYGVQVIATLYGFGNVVYDTNTFGIGRLNPKETRAFSIRFANFEDIENISKYECVATFQR